MNNEQGDYILIGSDLTSMRLQPGFVEGIKADRKQFTTLVAAVDEAETKLGLK